MAQKQKTAIIIGAGPAGLTAAYKLLTRTDYSPVILEASGVIGGISQTHNHNGNRMDIGGHRFFSKNDEVNALWKELMPLQAEPSYDDRKLGISKPIAVYGPDPECQDRVMLLRNRISRIFFKRKFFDYPISMKPETFINMGFKDTMKAGFGYIGACMRKLPETSLENFYINRFGRPLYEMFFEDYTTKLWGRSPSEISADWGAQRVKGLSLMKTFTNIITKPFRSGKNVETSLIEQYYYPKYGPGQLWETLAMKVRELGGEIVMNAEVEKLKVEGDKVISVMTKDGREYAGDEFISTMPIKDLVAGMPAPQNIKSLAAGLPYRDFMTVGLLVNRLKLKNKTKHKTLTGDVPDCWIYIQERDVKIGRLQIFNNWSPYMVKDPEHTVWIGLEYFCNEGDEYWNMSDDEFIQFAVSELEKIDIIEPGAVIDSTRLKVKKAYPAYFDTYEHFDEIRNYLDSIDNLWCIGRNGQHKYNNMDHSMLTAIEAVKAISTGNHDKRDVWNVNTEKEYHEEKPDTDKEGM